LEVGGEEQRTRGIETLAGFGACSLAGAIILGIFGSLLLAGAGLAVGVGLLAFALRLRRQRPPA
jgi:hypothetical protein